MDRSTAFLRMFSTAHTHLTVHPLLTCLYLFLHDLRDTHLRVLKRRKSYKIEPFALKNIRKQKKGKILTFLIFSVGLSYAPYSKKGTFNVPNVPFLD